MGNSTRFMELYSQIKGRSRGASIKTNGIDHLEALEVIMDCMEDLKEDLGKLRSEAGSD